MRYFDRAISLSFSLGVGLKLKKPCKEYNRAFIRKIQAAGHTSRGLFKKDHMYERGLHKTRIAALGCSREPHFHKSRYILAQNSEKWSGNGLVWFQMPLRDQ